MAFVLTKKKLYMPKENQLDCYFRVVGFYYYSIVFPSQFLFNSESYYKNRKNKQTFEYLLISYNTQTQKKKSRGSTMTGPHLFNDNTYERNKKICFFVFVFRAIDSLCSLVIQI